MPRRRLMSIALLAGACAAGGGELAVRLDAPPPEGVLVFMLFDSPDAFHALRDPVRTWTAEADGQAVYRRGDVPPGRYALLVFLDENGNGQLDRNFIGIPREPVGFPHRYRPKGPPSYARARFELAADTPLALDVALARPLGRRGRLGLGAGALAQSSPYRGADGAVLRVIPALTYIGGRVEILGPVVRVRLAGSGDLRLAATARYRVGAYAEDDAPILGGLGDRHDTLMAGLAAQAELPAGFSISAGAEQDALGEIGGGTARLSLGRGFTLGAARLTPSAGLNWRSASFAAHEFGVPAAAATAARPAYRPGAALNAEAGLGLFLELSRDWQLIVNAGVERLDRELTDSPLVDRHLLLSGFAALSYSL